MSLHVCGYPDGTRMWTNKTGLHRDKGLPAVENDAEQLWEWWVDGRRCRRDGLPTIERCGNRSWATGALVYHMVTELFDAILRVIGGGLKSGWYPTRHLHRDGGLPAMVDSDGRRWWVRNGRVDPLPVNETWTTATHLQWHGRSPHEYAHELIMTFLIGYEYVERQHGLLMPRTMLEEILACGRWWDYIEGGSSRAVD